MRQLWRDPTPLTMTNDATGNDFNDPQKRKQIQRGVHAEPLEAQIWQFGDLLVEDQYREFQYKILESLAKGGYGATYKARDLKNKQDVVIKAIYRRSSEYRLDLHIQSFFDEYTRLMKLEGIPHVVPPLRLIWDDRGLPAIVMEFIDGEPLKPLLSQEVAVVCMQQVIDALIPAHNLGILHRDLKPNNLLQRRLPNGDLEIVVVDWGCAREYTTDNTLTPFGTKGYAPPEQFSGQPQDERSDMYSLCATFYGLITEANLSEWRWGSPLPQTEGLDKALCRIFEKGLAKEPADRYGSMQELKRELERWKQRSSAEFPQSVTEALTGPRLKKPKKTRKQPWSRPLVWGSVGVGVLALLVGLGRSLELLCLDPATCTPPPSPSPTLSSSPSPPVSPTPPPTVTPTPVVGCEVEVFQTYGFCIDDAPIASWQREILDPEASLMRDVALYTAPERDAGSEIVPELAIEVKDALPGQTLQESQTVARETVLNGFLEPEIVKDDCAATLGQEEACILVYTGTDDQGWSFQRYQVRLLNRGREYVMTYSAGRFQYERYFPEIEQTIGSFRLLSSSN